MASSANSTYGPVEHNYTMMQAFEWYVPGGGIFWKDLESRIRHLSDIGITAMWLPPATKASSKDSVGYDVYDLWDLGEFGQKAGISTKYGTKAELLSLLNTARENHIVCYIDAVLNHRFGADRNERFAATMVAREDRTRNVKPTQDIVGWTAFDFPGRTAYSDFKWNFNHFTGVDWDESTRTSAIYRIEGANKGWAMAVDHEYVNYDFLMAADVDHAHPEAAGDILAWGTWVTKELDHVGFRFDALKHIDENFTRSFLTHVRENSGKDKLFGVGEYWNRSVEDIMAFMDRFGQQFSIFDTPLHYNFADAAAAGENYDLRRIWDGSLVQVNPVDAVTLVDNHDTVLNFRNFSNNIVHNQQIGQSLQSWVVAWFKPLAYSLILLRADGYPCVFYGDLYGTNAGTDSNPPAQPAVNQLQDIIRARKLFAYGDTRDYWDYPTCVGWVRTGDESHDGCAVVICNGTAAGTKWMEVGKEHAGETYFDLLGWTKGQKTINEEGWAEFECPSRSIGIWISSKAKGCKHFKAAQ